MVTPHQVHVRGFSFGKKMPSPFLFLPWVLFCTYVWTLPLLAMLNDCHTTAVCRYALQQEGSTSTTACSCGESAFGDVWCTGSSYGITISHLLGGMQGNTGMALVSAVPLLNLLFFGTGSVRTAQRSSVLFWTLLVTAFGYCCFLMAPSCMHPEVHEAAVLAFAGFGVIHFLLASKDLHRDGHTQVLVMCGVCVGSFAGLCASAFVVKHTRRLVLLPWAFECVGICTAFAMPIVMVERRIPELPQMYRVNKRFLLAEG